MRFLRQLAAATVTVAVIVALGVAWAHASGPGGHGPGPAAGAPQKFRVLHGTVASGRAVPARARVDGGLSLASARSLVRTAAAETILITAVVTVSAARRGRARRRRALS